MTDEHEHEHEFEIEDLGPIVLGPFGPDGPSPEDFDALATQLAEQLARATQQMKGQQIAQGMMADFGGWLLEHLREPTDDPHEEITTDQKTEDHAVFIQLVDDLRAAIDPDEPPTEWSDGMKLRSLAMMFWAWTMADGGCVHDAEVQQDLLRMADRLDQLDLLERGAQQYDFDPDYQAGLADEGEEE